MKVQEGIRYTENHEWVRVDGEFVWVGISDFAQTELGEIVHVELPEIGDDINAGDPIGTLEAVKTVEDVYTPISGEVVKVNSDLFDMPDIINKSPYEDGWLVQVRYHDKNEIEKLMTSSEYQKFVEEK